ncbi:aspartate carbamoyltransferase [Staphylococcus epidermidis]|uniref:aspartate/ornithine carbamoyltransferase family protein n=1 Tax=Staphylococcus epidermidis TaxID=1282 RepID=UPI000354FC61|nr:aspartate carbamoyltransferase [Staphylococcus epidermidis]EPP67810.1 aspartate carbamoyltransferase [Staphylococcus epidermidis Scl22]ESR04252.1 aspartate carbamoyltransferase [Staphylococcus epidermidis CIM28]ESR27897.1 aspartate carbamoyltransferase [Staphylococcus epidermidis APO35]ESU03174.1 aspartate carbamoyltransferase [Staphylococcus epidermidis CIM37]ESV10414.1 aspartate carbamoyltransferase [Staphylococcus epidermidis MC28]
MINNLLSMNNVNLTDINTIFEKADYYGKALKNGQVIKNLEGKILATLFFQPSTRTRMSFTSAMYRLGGQVIDMGGPKVARTDHYFDEIMSDTIKYIEQYSDIMVMRHFQNYTVEKASKITHVPIINAGDGTNEHPTQALLDLYTMSKELNGLENKVIDIGGDINCRVIRSIVIGLEKFSIKKIVFLLPNGQELNSDILNLLKNTDYSIVHNVERVLEQADILDIIPFELPDFNSAYSEKVDEKTSLENNLIVSKEKFNDKNKIPILSPGPREEELSSDTDNMDNVIFTKQAYNGLLIRMALLYYFLH